MTHDWHRPLGSNEMTKDQPCYTWFLVFAVCCVLGFPAVAEAADCHCDHCGCHKITKVTRLVKTCTLISIPKYEKNLTSSYFPKKGMVPHCKHRCEPNYEVCGRSCVCGKCIEREEPCEIITHVVKKGPCPEDTVCSTEEHHDSHFDYEFTVTNRYKITSCPTSECQTNMGASPCGCFKDVCLPTPTGEQCECVVPVVKWVTFNVCPDCKHHWAAHE